MISTFGIAEAMKVALAIATVNGNTQSNLWYVFEEVGIHKDLGRLRMDFNTSIDFQAKVNKGRE